MPDFGQLSTFAGLDPNRSYRTPNVAPQPLYMAPGPAEGLVTPGNIDLRTLPVVPLEDGMYGTVRSASREVEGLGEMLYPTIVNGQPMDDEQAFNYALKTGRHLGIFKDGKTANDYAQRLHEDWEKGKILGTQLQGGGVAGIGPGPRPTSFVQNYYEQAPGQIRQGFQQLVGPSGTTAADPRFWEQKAQGLNQIMAGVTPFALPLALTGIGAAEAPAAALLGLGGGTAAGLGTEEAARRLGVPPGQAGLLGTMAGMAGGGLAAAPETAEAATSAGRALRNIDFGSERGSWSWKPLTKLNDIPEGAGSEIPKAGNRLTINDLGAYFNDRIGKTIGQIPADASPKVKLNRILKLAVPEFEDQLSKPDPKLDFYTKDASQAEADIKQAFPSLRKNAAKLTVQRAVSAAMSPANNPDVEALIGGQVWNGYEQTGKFPLMNPSGVNWRGQNPKVALSQMQKYLDYFGGGEKGERALAKFLMTKHTVKDLRALNPNVGGSMNDVVPGSLILGEKVGRYFLDLMGVPQEGSTIDRWEVRGNQRRLGDTLREGKLIDTPLSRSDREVMMELHRILADKYGLTRNQAQSGSWHYEKDLYTRLGVPSPATGRSEGTQKLLESMGQTRKR